MAVIREPDWGPAPLVVLLAEQLAAHGFEEPDAAACAGQLSTVSGAAATAALFGDLGACNFLQGDIEGAVSAWRRAMSSGQPTPTAQAMVNLAMTFEHLGLQERAISIYDAAIEHGIEPFATTAALAAARSIAASGDHETATERLAAVTESLRIRRPSSSDLTDALCGLGACALAANRVAHAERAWREASDRGSVPAWRGLVSLMQRLGRLDEVRELIARMDRAVDMVSAADRLSYAVTLADVGGSTDAVETLATVAGNDLLPIDRFQFAAELRRHGLVNESIGELEVLLSESQPEHHLRAAFCLGEIYVDHEMTDQATEMFEEVVDADDPYWSSKAALGLGDICHERGDAEQAVAFWVKAVSSPVAEVRSGASERLTRRVRESDDLAESDSANDFVNHGVDHVHVDHVNDAAENGAETNGAEMDGAEPRAGVGTSAEPSASSTAINEADEAEPESLEAGEVPDGEVVADGEVSDDGEVPDEVPLQQASERSPSADDALTDGELTDGERIEVVDEHAATPALRVISLRKAAARRETVEPEPQRIDQVQLERNPRREVHVPEIAETPHKVPVEPVIDVVSPRQHNGPRVDLPAVQLRRRSEPSGRPAISTPAASPFTSLSSRSLASLSTDSQRIKAQSSIDESSVDPGAGLDDDPGAGLGHVVLDDEVKVPARSFVPPETERFAPPEAVDPYADLAPNDLSRDEIDLRPKRNPYAELAPRHTESQWADWDISPDPADWGDLAQLFDSSPPPVISSGANVSTDAAEPTNQRSPKRPKSSGFFSQQTSSSS